MPNCRACGKPIGFRETEHGNMMPVELGVKKALDHNGVLVEVQIVHWCKEYDKTRKRKKKKGD